MLGLVPAVLLSYYLVEFVPRDSLGIDFRDSFWPAAQAVLHGRSPYPARHSPAVSGGEAFVYPPLVAIALAPLGLLSVGPATLLVIGVSLAALTGTLWVLGVRDWRCYGTIAASTPVLESLQTAALSPLLALAIAIAWKQRRSGVGMPLAIVAAIVAKLFLWPLLVWVVIVRGPRTGAATASAAVILVVLPWLLGFPGGRAYPQLLSELTRIEGADAFTPRSLALALGAGTIGAQAAALALGGAVIAIAIAICRKAGAEQRTLALCVLAALWLSPIVWGHYLVILLPTLAIARPRLSAIWFAPLILWYCGGPLTPPTALQITVCLGVMGIVTLCAFRLRRSDMSVRLARPAAT